MFCVSSLSHLHTHTQTVTELSKCEKWSWKDTDTYPMQQKETKEENTLKVIFGGMLEALNVRHEFKSNKWQEFKSKGSKIWHKLQRI